MAKEDDIRGLPLPESPIECYLYYIATGIKMPGIERGPFNDVQAYLDFMGKYGPYQIGGEPGKEPTQHYGSSNEFPNIGNAGTVYIDEQANKTYRWDDKEKKYFCVGSDYREVTNINCGNA